MSTPVHNALLWVPVAIAVAVAMDVWAALLHRRVWHRWLWRVHRSHHVSHHRAFEANDLLSFVHAPVAVAFILHGCSGASGPLREIVFGAGVGMTLFGLAYVVVHDGLVHGRLPVRALLRVAFLRAVVRAHEAHHQGAFGGRPFGLFFGPLELALHRRLKRARSTSRASPRGPSALPSTGPARSGPRARRTGGGAPSC